MKKFNAIRATALALAIAAASGATLAQSDALYTTHVTPGGLIFEPNVEESLSTGIELVISGPGDFRFEKTFAPGALTEFSPDGKSGPALADGSYRYELVVRSIAGVQRSRDDSSVTESIALNGGSGSFTVVDGRIVDPTLVEADDAAPKSSESPAAASSPPPSRIAKFGESLEQVISGDLTVRFSLCVGGDCANSESFGADTIRLKENNLRIHFNDTSNSASFPTTDWRITANDSNNGGASRFSIDDADNGRTPFTIEAGSRSNALYVDSGTPGSRIGFGTSTPAVQLHQRDGNTPTLRLDQDGSSGFQSQIWDIAGNEANFFIRDVTNGSKLPFKIRPGADDDSLVIEDDNHVTINAGNLGVGTTNPSRPITVTGSSGSAGILVEENQDPPAVRTLLDLVNNGQPKLRLQDDSQTNVRWELSVAGTQPNDQFILNKIGSGALEMALSGGGDVTFAGTVNSGSSRSIKERIEPVDPNGILDRLQALPIQEWSYIASPGERRIGPMAEDFHRHFGLGPDAAHVSATDMAGVSMAAIQAIAGELDRKDRQMQALRAEIEALRTLVERAELDQP